MSTPPIPPEIQNYVPRLPDVKFILTMAVSIGADEKGEVTLPVTRIIEIIEAVAAAAEQDSAIETLKQVLNKVQEARDSE